MALFHQSDDHFETPEVSPFLCAVHIRPSADGFVDVTPEAKTKACQGKSVS